MTLITTQVEPNIRETSKNERIKSTLKATRQRRKTQECKVYELKIIKAKLDTSTLKNLNQIFLEGKWFYNHCLNQQDVFNVNTKIKTVPVKVGDDFEHRDLKRLSSQMKQSISTGIQSSIRGLATKKKQGEKVGRLKFIKSFKAMDLKQYGNTYKFVETGNKSPKLKIQRLSKLLPICGYDQIPETSEFANAKLTKKHGNFFLKVTT